MQSATHHACAPIMLLATETKTLGKAKRSSPRSVISQPSTETMIARGAAPVLVTGDDDKAE